MVMAGVNLRTVTEEMGHKTIQMMMRYTHLALKHRLVGVERIVTRFTTEPLQAEPSATTSATGSEDVLAVEAAPVN
jgi:hypothetical protein